MTLDDTRVEIELPGAFGIPGSEHGTSNRVAISLAQGPEGRKRLLEKGA